MEDPEQVAREEAQIQNILDMWNEAMFEDALCNGGIDGCDGCPNRESHNCDGCPEIKG